MAVSGRVEESEARRLVITLLRLEQEEDALNLFRRLFREHPNWAKNSALLQLRGRMYYQMAKRCAWSARSPNLRPKMKANAWDECRRYLEEAERDFRAALEHGPDPVVEDYARRGLEVVERLKEKTKKPDRR
jgi:tetratricopeptide (TPR) repeat protein